MALLYIHSGQCTIIKSLYKVTITNVSAHCLLIEIYDYHIIWTYQFYFVNYTLKCLLLFNFLYITNNDVRVFHFYEPNIGVETQMKGPTDLWSASCRDLHRRQHKKKDSKIQKHPVRTCPLEKNPTAEPRIKSGTSWSSGNDVPLSQAAGHTLNLLHISV